MSTETRRRRIGRAVEHTVYGLAVIAISILFYYLIRNSVDSANTGHWLTAIVWQGTAFGLANVFIWFTRIAGEVLRLNGIHLPKPQNPKSKPIRISVFHGITERALFGVLAIPFFKDDPANGGDFPLLSGFLVAVVLYIGLRGDSSDMRGRLSIYSSWNMLISVALGVSTGWVFWNSTTVLGWLP